MKRRRDIVHITHIYERFYIYTKGIPEKELNVHQRNNKEMREISTLHLRKSLLFQSKGLNEIQERIWRKTTYTKAPWVTFLKFKYIK